MKVTAAVVLALALGVAGCALDVPDTYAIAPHHPGTFHVVRMPTSADIRHVYPPAAKVRGLTGVVWVRCVLNAEGAMANCYVESESPPDAGFGAAALRAIVLLRWAPDVPGTSMAGRQVRMPINFNLD